METTTHSDNVYHPALWRKFAVAVAVVTIVAVFVFFVYLALPPTKWYHVVILLSATFSIGMMCLAAYQYVFHSHVIVTENGLETTGLYQATVQWDGVEQFDWNGNRMNRRWGIRVNHELDARKGAWKNAFENNFIPLSHIIGRPPYKSMQMVILHDGVDLDKFAQTPLGQDLLHYAPHLFDSE